MTVLFPIPSAASIATFSRLTSVSLRVTQSGDQIRWIFQPNFSRICCRMRSRSLAVADEWYDAPSHSTPRINLPGHDGSTTPRSTRNELHPTCGITPKPRPRILAATDCSKGDSNSPSPICNASASCPLSAKSRYRWRTRTPSLFISPRSKSAARIELTTMTFFRARVTATFNRLSPPVPFIGPKFIVSRPNLSLP